MGWTLCAKFVPRSTAGKPWARELFTCGPLFTARGGHGTEYFKDLPENIRENAEKQFTRLPSSAEEARQQVDELKKQGVDCIKAILEAGAGGRVFHRLDTGLFDAVAQAAHADDLPLAVHTGDARDVADAVQAQANSIEHGSFREAIPDEQFEQMAKQGTFYDPTLSVGEGVERFRRREDKPAEALAGAAGWATGIARRALKTRWRPGKPSQCALRSDAIQST